MLDEQRLQSLLHCKLVKACKLLQLFSSKGDMGEQDSVVQENILISPGAHPFWSSAILEVTK